MKITGIFGKKETPVNIDFRIRVDVQHSFFHNIRFVFSDRAVCRDDLPVEICETHLIVVNEVKGADAAAHQCFADIAAHAADAEHGHARPLELFHRLRAEQQLRS